MNKRIIIIPVLALLITAGARVTIDMGVVPIVLTTFFIYLGGLLFGSKTALAATALYVVSGALGLPVYAGGTGGIERLLGPTGGYLLGFMIAAFTTGFISERGNSLIRDALALLLAAILLHTSGLTWLYFYSAEAWQQTFGQYWIFITAETIRLTVILITARIIKKRWPNSGWIQTG
ncbi:MAG: biotin transporter BioY [Balneolia bacterium]|nr:biotin transporter BioY [Balneolia bacterium]